MQGVMPTTMSTASLHRLPLRPEGTHMSPHETEAHAMSLIEHGRLVEGARPPRRAERGERRARERPRTLWTARTARTA
eukprot:1035313-Prymnesium_polylepis.2